MNDLQVSSSWKDKTEEWSQVREDQGGKKSRTIGHLQRYSLLCSFDGKKKKGKQCQNQEKKSVL